MDHCQNMVILVYSLLVFPDFESPTPKALLHLSASGNPGKIRFDMCDTQTLASSSEGYLIRCSDCGRMQLCFGIVAAALRQDHFNRIKVSVDEVMLYGSGYSTDPERRSISIPLNKSVILCLNWTEFLALEELVSQAHALLEVYDMLADEIGNKGLNG